MIYRYLGAECLVESRIERIWYSLQEDVEIHTAIDTSLSARGTGLAGKMGSEDHVVHAAIASWPLRS